MMNPKIIGTGAALAGVVLLAGCSSSKSTTGASGGSTVTAAPSAPTVPSKQLTGTQLASALLGGSDLPVGFTASQGAANNSGASLTTAAAKYDPTKLTCTALLNDMGEAGFGENAEASTMMASPDGKEMLSEAVYQFSTASAANVFFTGIEAKWQSCGSFNPGSGTLTVTVATAPSDLGQMAFANTMTGTESSAKVAGGTLAVLDGTDVLVLGPVDLSGVQPADLSAQPLMQKLISHVATAS